MCHCKRGWEPLTCKEVSYCALTRFWASFVSTQIFGVEPPGVRNILASRLTLSASLNLPCIWICFNSSGFGVSDSPISLFALAWASASIVTASALPAAAILTASARPWASAARFSASCFARSTSCWARWTSCFATWTRSIWSFTFWGRTISRSWTDSKTAGEFYIQ